MLYGSVPGTLFCVGLKPFPLALLPCQPYTAPPETQDQETSSDTTAGPHDRGLSSNFSLTSCIVVTPLPLILLKR